MVLNLKRNKTFKVIITALLVTAFIVSVVSCKEAPVVVEEQVEDEQGEEIKNDEVVISSETKEETTKETTQETTTQETTAPTETTPQLIEYKGSVFPLPEASEANPQTGEILALYPNPYGVEAKTKIGQCIINAFELNGQMENSIALRPEVIEFLQMQQFKEKGKIFIPIPLDLVDLDKAEGVKINEVESLLNMEGKADFAAGKYTSLVFTVPEMTTVYSFLNVKYTGEPRTGLVISHSFFEPETDWYNFGFYSPDNMSKEKLVYEGFQQINEAGFSMWCLGAKLDDSLLDEKVKSTEESFKTSTKVGEPLCKIVIPPNKELAKQIFSGLGSIEIYFRLQQGSADGGLEKELITGKDILLEINKTKVSILPAQ